MSAATVVVSKEDARISTYAAKAYGALAADSELSGMTILRREPRPSDVQIEIRYCGICHTDLHFARNDWATTTPTTYPSFPDMRSLGR